jgi:hypothetical protein
MELVKSLKLCPWAYPGLDLSKQPTVGIQCTQFRQMKYHPLPSHQNKTNSRIFTSLLATSTVQSHQFFEITLPTQFFELKSEEANNKNENPCDNCPC